MPENTFLGLIFAVTQFLGIMFRTFISAHSTMFCFQNQLLPFVFSTLSGKKSIFSSLIFKNLFLFQRYFDFPKLQLPKRKLSKYVLAAALGPLACSSRRARPPSLVRPSRSTWSSEGLT